MSRTEPAFPSLPELTKKQREVLALVADNRTSKEIAARLGISESAVNQRIEIVRARLGGLPRGELARLYRQEYMPAETATEVDGAERNEFSPTWQKIHLPTGVTSREGRGVEGLPFHEPDGSQPDQERDRKGSQLSAVIFGRYAAVPSRGDRPAVFARGAFILAILLAGMAIAAGITELVAPAFAGH
ncbi:sigma factor-like helix-turn-helix DNA-binding protein [Novosphingobium sp.]|uniref:sigma factor-like helix-turn-helix DNA-binding protein n=1 Tax=Novosphingobium sp. TaxID=1874826 RepID=UPI0035B2C627